MKFNPTAIDGAFIIDLAPARDERGSFSRIFCTDSFAKAGAPLRPVQVNLSKNPLAGTLRGLHFQVEPHGEIKLVQCVRGRIFDVAVDLRPASPTYLASVGVELFPDAERLFHIPAGCAHGYLTLEPDSDVLYQVSAAYAPAAASGVRWNDPAFGIDWPMQPVSIADRDANYPDYAPVNR
jgi:dTDP-4-dehydrorhamnose 3,5-epimerase